VNGGKRLQTFASRSRAKSSVDRKCLNPQTFKVDPQKVQPETFTTHSGKYMETTNLQQEAVVRAKELAGWLDSGQF